MKELQYMAELLDNRRYLMAQVNELESKIQMEASNIPRDVIVAEIMGVIKFNFPVPPWLRDRFNKIAGVDQLDPETGEVLNK